MKLWKKMDQVFYSDVIAKLNMLEQQHAVVKSITATSDNFYTIFYTVEEDYLDD